jgi:aminoglycoside phosphotransferase (APT) family kinase protein
MSAIKVPAAEINIDAARVAALVNEQFPEFSHLPVSFLGYGWDNENYRLGTDYLVRLPRRAVAAPSLEKEMAWLPQLAPLLPIDIPAAIRLGMPSALFPWVWCIIPWFEGGIGGELEADEALRLADFLKTLHAQPCDALSTSTYRGMPLSTKHDTIYPLLQRLRGASVLVNDHIERLWKEAVNAPFDPTPSFLHGDLHPRNVVIADSRIRAVIDWGDLCQGDAATDLASFWMLFSDENARASGLARYGADATAIARAKGWAVMLGLILLDTGLGGDASYLENGERILGNLG